MEVNQWVQFDIDTKARIRIRLVHSCVLVTHVDITPVMYLDPSGEFFIALTTIALIVGAVIGATTGGLIAYNIAKNTGAEGWELFGWTAIGVVGGGVIGAAVGYGAGTLISNATGFFGFSVTKYSITAIKSITVLGHMPGYIGAAQAGGAGYYLISNDLYSRLVERGMSLANNLQYLKDAYRAGSQFVICPDYLVRTGGALWQEIHYLVEQGIAFFLA